MNPKAARIFRSMVLEHGARQPEADIIRRYMGREPNADAFYSELSGGMDREGTRGAEP